MKRPMMKLKLKPMNTRVLMLKNFKIAKNLIIFQILWLHGLITKKLSWSKSRLKRAKENKKIFFGLRKA